MPSNHLILCHLCLLLPSVFPSVRVFSNESVLYVMWPKYFSFSISPSNEYAGVISFMIDWFDLLAVQGLARVFSNTTVQNYQFFSTWLSLQSNSHIHTSVQFSSVQLLSHVHSLRPHGLQYTSLVCPSPTPGACANSCPSSWWCHPTISSFDVPISSYLQSFLTSGSFQMSQLFTSVAKIPEFQLQHQSFQWIFRTDFL